MEQGITEINSPADLLPCAPLKPVPRDYDPREEPIYKDLAGFYRIERHLALVMQALLVTTSLLLGVLMSVQVFLRYVVELPLLGIEELAPLLAVWIYFIGMAYATRERDHISGGIVTLLFKNQSVVSSIRLAATVLCLTATIVYTYHSWSFAEFSINLGRKSVYMKWPKYLWDISMFIGFVLTSMYLAVQVWVDFKTLRRAANWAED